MTHTFPTRRPDYLFNRGSVGNTPITFRWPGFLTDYDNAGDIRVTRVSDDVAMPIGAQLESCDGLSATAYAEATLGTMWGRWNLESQRRLWGRWQIGREHV